MSKDAPPEEQIPAPSRAISGRLLASGEQDATWHVAEEVPVSLRYNGSTLAVLVTSPADLEDFARGFSLTEGIIESADEITSISHRWRPPGIEMQISVPARRANRMDVQRRTRALVAASSCGICGMSDFAAFEETPRPVAPSPVALDHAVVTRAVQAFTDGQIIKAVNRSVHGAAFANPNGDILCLREDVGRHNALDKLIGAMMLAGLDPVDGFFIISSRCSFEMVQKVIRAKGRALVSMSAPTYMAVRMAADANLALAVQTQDGDLFLPKL